MKNTFGTALCVTLFGESHGDTIGCVIDGLAPGIGIDGEKIDSMLSRRRPSGLFSTSRVETDRWKIVSGVLNGRTTGAPLCILLPNKEQNSGDYNALSGIARPGHADYAAYLKYRGFEDHRGGGHFSGRMTAPLVAAGAIALSALEKKGIRIGCHVSELHGIKDDPLANTEEEITALNESSFPVLNEKVGEIMKAAILDAKKNGDSLGGILETEVLGVPGGLGEPWFDSVESLLSHAMFSIPGVKGIEFGSGFAFSVMKGSECSDPLRVKGGRVESVYNHNGGINGGITNGMPILFRLALKPTPSISTEQETVDFIRMENVNLSVSGRHDPAFLHRVCVVSESLTALVLYDLLAIRCGTDYFAEAEG